MLPPDIFPLDCTGWLAVKNQSIRISEANLTEMFIIRDEGKLDVLDTMFKSIDS